MFKFEETNNDMCGIYIEYKNPVANENSRTHGISHLLEHMMCEATDDMDEIYDEHCIETNAFTSNDNVVFYLSGLSEHVNSFKDDYIKRIISYTPTKEDFDKQLPIVTQEYNDWFGKVFNSIYSNYFSKYYGFNDCIGTREALTSVTFEEVMQFKNKVFSNPSNIIIVDKQDSEMSFPIKFQENVPTQFQNTPYINKDMEINDLSVGYAYGSKLVPNNGKNYYFDFISEMFGYGLKSPLYQEVREKNGLSYWVSCFSESILNKSFLMVCTSIKKENQNILFDKVNSVLTHPEKYLTKERFDLVYSNVKIRQDIKKQNKYKLAYIYKYLVDPSLSMSFNLDKINYDEMLDYYNQYIHPNNNAWDFASQFDLYK